MMNLSLHLLLFTNLLLWFLPNFVIYSLFLFKHILLPYLLPYLQVHVQNTYNT